MEQILKIIKQVEQTHKGLGVACSFAFLTVLAQKGLFLISSKGSGKGSVINSINQFDHHQDYKTTSWTSMNYHDIYGMLDKCYSLILLWKLEEFSALSKYNREILLPLASVLITQGNFRKYITEKFQIIVEDCKLVFLIGIQPLKFKRLVSENENWESLASDRFIKFVLINPLRTRDDLTEPPPKFDVPKDIIYSKLKPKFETDCKNTIDLFEQQVSQGRAKQFSRAYLTAYAIANNVETITSNTEKEFALFYEPYLTIYSNFTYSTDLDEPDNFRAGDLRILELLGKYTEGLTSRQLAEKLHIFAKTKDDSSDEISTHNINYHLRILKYNNVIQNHKVGVTPYYFLSDKLQNYFDNYRNNWCK